MLVRRQKLKAVITAVLVVFAVAAAIGIAVWTLTDARTVFPKDSFYQYFNDRRFDYSSEAKIIIGETAVVISDENIESATDTSPIYYENSESFVVPRVMSWVSPYTGEEWQVPLFSKFDVDEDEKISCRIGEKIVTIANGFLFDGVGTYVFLDDMIVHLDGVQHTIGKMSFVVVNATGNIRIYDYTDKSYTWEDATTNSMIAEAASQDYSIELTNNSMLMADGNMKLLFIEPELLDPLS